MIAPDESYPLTGASMTPFLGYRKTLPVIEQPEDPLIRLIPLTRGLCTIVDASDYEWLSQWRWVAREKRLGLIYAYRNPYRRSGETGSFAMHRVILGLSKNDRLDVDHINRNPLDNRRANLRTCTHQQNTWNQPARRSNKSGHKGVYLHKASGLWHSRLMINGKSISLGYYHTPEEAHEAYRKNALLHFGEYACHDRL